MTIDATFWVAISFIIFILLLFYFKIPAKVQSVLDDNINKIKDDLDEAKELNELAEKKNLEYENMLIKAKKDVAKILLDSKNQLDKSIN